MYQKNVYFSVQLITLEILLHRVIMECANQYVHHTQILLLNLQIIQLKDVYLCVHKVRVHLEIQLLFHVLKYVHLAGMPKDFTLLFLPVIVYKPATLIHGVKISVEHVFKILSIVLPLKDITGMLIILLLHV